MRSRTSPFTWYTPLPRPVRLSNASFVSCAAAVGGEKTAASTPHTASRHHPEGRTKKGTLPPPGSERGYAAAGGSVHEKGVAGVRPSSGARGAESPEKENSGTPENIEEEPSRVLGVEAVALELSRRARVPTRRAASAPLYFAFDHCFSVRGQGTILTGTVLTGEVKVRSRMRVSSFFRMI